MEIGPMHANPWWVDGSGAKRFDDPSCHPRLATLPPSGDPTACHSAPACEAMRGLWFLVSGTCCDQRDLLLQRLGLRSFTTRSMVQFNYLVRCTSRPTPRRW